MRRVYGLKAAMGTLLATALALGWTSLGCRQGGVASDGDGDQHHQHEADARGVSSDHRDPHDRHADPEDDAGAQVVHVDAQLREDLGIVVATAGPGYLQTSTELPGQVHVNDDHLAHVTPRVAGVVREVVVTLGDRVKKGQVLAVLESRELADAVSEWLAAHQRRALAERVASREERLFEQRVSAEQDYLDATTARAEAEIELR